MLQLGVIQMQVACAATWSHGVIGPELLPGAISGSVVQLQLQLGSGLMSVAHVTTGAKGSMHGYHT